MSRAMKDSGIPWIGEIPSHWLLVPTKRVFRGEKRIAGMKADEYERLALTMQGVIKRDKEDNEGLQPEKFDGYQILQENELVFKLIDLQNVKTSRVGISPYTGIVSPAYIIISNSQTNNRFYYYWFLDMYYRLIFNQMGDDGVRSNLNMGDVLSIPIPSIPEKEQQLIADFLDKKCGEIDEMVSLQEKIIEELKEYRQSVITEAVCKGLNPDVPMKDSGIDWIGQIPEKWNVSRVGLHYSIILGKMLCDKPIDGGSLVPYFCAANVHFDGISTDELKKMWLSTEEQDKYRVQVGDLLVVEGGAGAGGCSIVQTLNEETYIQNSIMIVRSDNHDCRFLKYLIERLVIQGYIDFVCNKATIPHFTKDKLSQVPYVFPPFEEQQAIADYLDKKCAEIDTLISVKQSKIDALKEYKKSIIYEYITGKKEVVL